MNVWLRYPLTKAVAFLKWAQAEPSSTKVVMAHVLRIGPLAFMVCWQEAKP